MSHPSVSSPFPPNPTAVFASSGAQQRQRSESRAGAALYILVVHDAETLPSHSIPLPYLPSTTSNPLAWSLLVSFLEKRARCSTGGPTRSDCGGEMSERGRDPGDGSNWRMFPANKKPRRTPVNTNLSLLPSRRAEDGQGGAEEENAAAAQQATGGGVESRTLDLISAINRPAGTSSADHAGPRTLDLISEIGRTGTSSSNDQAGGGDGQGRGSAPPPPPPQGGNALSHARSAPNAMGPGIFSGEMDGRDQGKRKAKAGEDSKQGAGAKKVRGSDAVAKVGGGGSRGSTDDVSFPFLRDARRNMLSQRPQRQERPAEQHPASHDVPNPVGRDGGLACTGVPQAAQQQHEPRGTQHETPAQEKMAEDGGVGGGHIGPGTGRPDELALRGGTTPSGGTSKSIDNFSGAHHSNSRVLAQPMAGTEQEPPEGSEGQAPKSALIQDHDTPGAKRGMKGKRRVLPPQNKEPRIVDTDDIVRANEAILRAVGGYVPFFARDALLLLPPQPLPAIVESEKQQPPEAGHLDLAADHPVGSKVHHSSDPLKDTEDTHVPLQRRLQEQALVAAQTVPASGATALNLVPEPQLEPQPEGTCPRCRIGRGTVARHHLCRCHQCPDNPSHDRYHPCPFCELVAVRTLKRPLKPEVGTCPCCCTRAGIASQEIPDAVCLHCSLARVPLPKNRRDDGACPCCMEHQGRVSTQHLCLCETCKKLPHVLCPFCMFMEMRVALVSFSVMLFYCLTMW